MAAGHDRDTRDHIEQGAGPQSKVAQELMPAHRETLVARIAPGVLKTAVDRLLILLGLLRISAALLRIVSSFR